MQSTAPSLWLVRDHGWASRPELLLSTPLPAHAANASHNLWLKCAGLELPLQAVRQLQDECVARAAAAAAVLVRRQ